MERIPDKKKDIAYRKLADEAMVVDFLSSFFYNLNPVATYIWDLCDGKHSIAQIAGELTEEYDVTLEEATRDCQEFINSLMTEGLLEWRDELF